MSVTDMPNAVRDGLDCFVRWATNRGIPVLMFLPAHGGETAESAGSGQPGRMGKAVSLTDDEERLAQMAGFRCHWPVHITGQIVGRRNLIVIDGTDVTMGDAPLRLFLRLVVGLFETPDGFLSTGTLKSGGGLAGEGLYTSDGVYNALSRVREPLRPRFVHLVETARGRGLVRLSVHPRYITWDLASLLAHPDQPVRELAARLPVRPPVID